MGTSATIYTSLSWPVQRCSGQVEYFFSSKVHEGWFPARAAPAPGAICRGLSTLGQLKLTHTATAMVNTNVASNQAVASCHMTTATGT